MIFEWVWNERNRHIEEGTEVPPRIRQVLHIHHEQIVWPILEVLFDFRVVPPVTPKEDLAVEVTLPIERRMDTVAEWIDIPQVALGIEARVP